MPPSCTPIIYPTTKNEVESESFMNTKKRESVNELVDVEDMELHCLTCGTRLYVSVPQARAVIDSLERTGATILLCLCGQAQLLQWRPRSRNN